jgi:hypothetical protein
LRFAANSTARGGRFRYGNRAAAQLNALAAAQPTANVISVEFDVTTFVKVGQILVSSSFEFK